MTRVEVNRACGCSSAPKKSADRRCLSRAAPAGVDASGFDRQLDSGAARAYDVRAAEGNYRYRSVALIGRADYGRGNACLTSCTGKACSMSCRASTLAS